MTTNQSTCRPALPLILLAFVVVSCSNEDTESSFETPESDLLPHQQMARDFLRELIEIDTTHSTGNTTIAADAMAAHLIAEGFAAEDVQVLGPKHVSRPAHPLRYTFNVTPSPRSARRQS